MSKRFVVAVISLVVIAACASPADDEASNEPVKVDVLESTEPQATLAVTVCNSANVGKTRCNTDANHTRQRCDPSGAWVNTPCQPGYVCFQSATTAICKLI